MHWDPRTRTTAYDRLPPTVLLRRSTLQETQQNPRLDSRRLQRLHGGMLRGFSSCFSATRREKYPGADARDERWPQMPRLKRASCRSTVPVNELKTRCEQEEDRLLVPYHSYRLIRVQVAGAKRPHADTHDLRKGARHSLKPADYTLFLQLQPLFPLFSSSASRASR